MWPPSPATSLRINTEPPPVDDLRETLLQKDLPALQFQVFESSRPKLNGTFADLDQENASVWFPPPETSLE